MYIKNTPVILVQQLLHLCMEYFESKGVNATFDVTSSVDAQTVHPLGFTYGSESCKCSSKKSPMIESFFESILIQGSIMNLTQASDKLLSIPISCMQGNPFS